MTRTQKVPDASHPITIEPFAGRVVVRAQGRVIADTTAALNLNEANYPPVPYLPLSDVDASVLTPSETTTYCPYKGEAGYHGISAVGDTPEITDALWYYPQPYEAVAQIADHVAFYPNKVEIEVRPS